MRILQTLLVLLLFATPAVAHEGHGEDASTAFASVLHHYEALWQTLASDSSDGLVEHAEGMREAADRVTADFSLKAAGMVDGTDAAEAEAFFSDLAKTALLLSSATDLTKARDAFYEISKTMVRLNEQRDGERLKVVYCAMTKRSWLQRQPEVVNPYHGKKMAGCGDVVAG